MKAVFPVAGRGTRLLPLTLHQPKAMVCIVDKPMIHYAIKEAVDSGADELIFVISPGQLQIKEYVESLDFASLGRGNVQVGFALQEEPLGNGDAIFKSKPLLTDEPAQVFFCDDVLINGAEIMREAYLLSVRKSAPVVILERVPRELVSKYGVVRARTSEPVGLSPCHEISGVVEKPEIDKAPSNLAVVGRYVLTPAVLDSIKALYAKHGRGEFGGEIGISDALSFHLEQGGGLYGLEFTGERFDCGSKLGLMKAQVRLSLMNPELGQELKTYFSGLII